MGEKGVKQSLVLHLPSEKLAAVVCVILPWLWSDNHQLFQGNLFLPWNISSPSKSERVFLQVCIMNLFSHYKQVPKANLWIGSRKNSWIGRNATSPCRESHLKNTTPFVRCKPFNVSSMYRGL